jgi:hypothetical protein
MTRHDRRGGVLAGVGCLRQSVPSLRKGNGGQRGGWSDGGRDGQDRQSHDGPDGGSKKDGEEHRTKDGDWEGDTAHTNCQHEPIVNAGRMLVVVTRGSSQPQRFGQ